MGNRIPNVIRTLSTPSGLRRTARTSFLRSGDFVTTKSVRTVMNRASSSFNAQRIDSESTSDDLHRYTSGRWLFDEDRRLQERVLDFNVAALKRTAAEAAGKSKKDVQSFQKLAEGGFNRSFLVTMHDGSEVVARLPYSIAFPAGLTVASEVATMQLVRENGVPVPAILDYSTTKKNHVGSEYIIMEMAKGKELGNRWYTLPDLDRAKIIGRLSMMEEKIFSIHLPAMGSIFAQADLDPAIERVNIGQTAFCIGPSVEQRWWQHDESSNMQFNKPHLSSQMYLEAGARKELAWLMEHGQPKQPAHQYREFVDYRPCDPAEHIESLQHYLRIAPYLVPSGADHEYLNRPTLRHPDINPRNVFVDDDLQITSLIDWQHSSAVPLFLQAGVPDLFENWADDESRRLTKPRLPDGLSDMSEDQRDFELHRYFRRHSHFYYFGAAYKFHHQHFKAMKHNHIALKQRLCFNASAPWTGNSIPLGAYLVEASQHWYELAKTPDACPISFTKEQQEHYTAINKAQDHVDEKISELAERIGISSDGWVSLDMYDAAVAENQRVKNEIFAIVSEKEKEIALAHWPFDNHKY